jgi:hypothetical protein
MLLSSGDSFPDLIQKRRTQLGFVTYILNYPCILFYFILFYIWWIMINMCYLPSAPLGFELEGNFLLQMVANIGTLIIYLHGYRVILLLFFFAQNCVFKLIKNIRYC